MLNPRLVWSEADWLLVHGMPGVGKTQLVADVLWEKPELCFATFGRIFWSLFHWNSFLKNPNSQPG
jgi:hypothetical protein